MEFMIAAYSDIGIKKKVNQDALIIKVAQTKVGKACLSIICDGMGGLSDGEVASATVVRAFEHWFEAEFPYMLEQGFSTEDLKLQWDNIIRNQNEQLKVYAARQGIKVGTTIVTLLIVENNYCIMNVGDSRAYLLDEQITVLTKDQTFIQHEIDMGRMTWEEAQHHPQRNVLLQCVGASDVVIPDFYYGQIYPDTVFMLCSDGFRHIISPQEIYEQLNPAVLTDEQTMRAHAQWLIKLNKYRHEADNISVALVRLCQEQEVNVCFK